MLLPLMVGVGAGVVQIPLRRSRLSGTVRATNPDKREPLTFET